MTSGGAASIALLALALAPATLGERAAPVISPLVLEWRGDRLHVGFEVQNGLTDESVERLHLGFPVTLSHRIEVSSRRAVPLWPSRVLARADVRATAVFDSLTRRYALRRTIETRGAEETVPAREETITTSSEQEMRDFLTHIEPIPLLSRSSSLRYERMRVRVDSVLGRRYLLLFVPTNVSVSAERRVDP